MLANLANLLGRPDRRKSGHARITISTVGSPKTRELATAGSRTTWSLLHAPNDPLRNELVPVNQNIGIAAVLGAADEFFEQTGRWVTHEYVGYPVAATTSR